MSVKSNVRNLTGGELDRLEGFVSDLREAMNRATSDMETESKVKTPKELVISSAERLDQMEARLDNHMDKLEKSMIDRFKIVDSRHTEDNMMMTDVAFTIAFFMVVVIVMTGIMVSQEILRVAGGRTTHIVDKLNGISDRLKALEQPASLP